MDSRQSRCFDNIANEIKVQAQALGFDACGYAVARRVDDAAIEQYERWIALGHHDCMEYATRYTDVRNDPRLLLPDAKTVISVALNYYPSTFQNPDAPQFAYYAYGEDYHEVMRAKLSALSSFIESQSAAKCRVCVDTAPIREKYWAQQAGIGFIGFNNLLIIPGRGSFFFLGEIVTTLSLPPDAPCTISCGDCHRCVEMCPGGAISDGSAVDASRCLSCQLIERRGELPAWVSASIGNRVYGCDLCQLACPHNSMARPTTVAEFAPSPQLLSLSHNDISQMTPEAFRNLFRHSAVKRTKLEGLIRNNSIADPNL